MNKPIFLSIITIFILTTTVNIYLFNHTYESESNGFEVWFEDYYFDNYKMQIIYNFTINNLYEYGKSFNYNVFFYNETHEINYFTNFAKINALSQLTLSIKVSLSSNPTYFNFNLDDGHISVNQRINL